MDYLRFCNIRYDSPFSISGKVPSYSREDGLTLRIIILSLAYIKNIFSEYLSESSKNEMKGKIRTHIVIIV